MSLRTCGGVAGAAMAAARTALVVLGLGATGCSIGGMTAAGRRSAEPDWVTLEVVDGVAYFLLIETAQEHWDLVAGTLKQSAATVVFKPSQASQSPSP